MGAPAAGSGRSRTSRDGGHFGDLERSGQGRRVERRVIQNRGACAVNRLCRIVWFAVSSSGESSSSWRVRQRIGVRASGTRVQFYCPNSHSPAWWACPSVEVNSAEVREVEESRRDEGRGFALLDSRSSDPDDAEPGHRSQRQVQPPNYSQGSPLTPVCARTVGPERQNGRKAQLANIQAAKASPCSGRI
jgi:hypothetical protein